MTNIRVETQGEGAPVVLDPQRMSQVFANLLLNAADAIDWASDISLLAKTTVRRFGFTTQGPVFRRTNYHIFDPFCRLNPLVGHWPRLSLQRIVEAAGESKGTNHPAGGGVPWPFHLPHGPRCPPMNRRAEGIAQRSLTSRPANQSANHQIESVPKKSASMAAKARNGPYGTTRRPRAASS